MHYTTRPRLYNDVKCICRQEVSRHIDGAILDASVASYGVFKICQCVCVTEGLVFGILRATPYGGEIR
jgi:hypothetical protein